MDGHILPMQTGHSYRTSIDVKADVMASIQTVSVSGTTFQMSMDTWTKMRRLVATDDLPKLIQTSQGVFTERHALAFQNILQYFQSGELHLPTDMCPSTFKR